MKKEEPIWIAADHAGFALKAELQKILSQWKWVDLGVHSRESADYPDFAEKLCEKVVAEKGQGILVCGSGIGMSIAANKIPGIRAALVENPVSARLSKQHNHTNVLCLGARFLGPEYAAEIVQTWLETPVDSDPRHLRRVQKTALLEKKSKGGSS